MSNSLSEPKKTIRSEVEGIMYDVEHQNIGFEPAVEKILASIAQILEEAKPKNEYKDEYADGWNDGINVYLFKLNAALGLRGGNK